jgi:hypothetical protein
MNLKDIYHLLAKRREMDLQELELEQLKAKEHELDPE